MATVSITLDGSDVELVPSLKAAQAVNLAVGGLMDAYQKIGTFDFNSYAAIIAAGTGKPHAQVAESVFKTGLKELAEPLAKFITLLGNGGRDPDAP